MPWPPLLHAASAQRRSTFSTDGRVHRLAAATTTATSSTATSGDSSPANLLNCDNVARLRRQRLKNRIPANSPCASCFFVNPVVTESFHLFVKSLVHRFKDDWDVPKMQARFDEFFAMFADHVPNRRQFATLVRN